MHQKLRERHFVRLRHLSAIAGRDLLGPKPLGLPFRRVTPPQLAPPPITPPPIVHHDLPTGASVLALTLADTGTKTGHLLAFPGVRNTIATGITFASGPVEATYQWTLVQTHGNGLTLLIQAGTIAAMVAFDEAHGQRMREAFDVIFGNETAPAARQSAASDLPRGR